MISILMTLMDDDGDHHHHPAAIEMIPRACPGPGPRVRFVGA
jgi:hypothetical protein